MRRGIGRNRLRAALDRRGMTVVELSRRTGLHESILRLWISGRSEPRLSNLRVLCRALGVSADYLAGLTDDMEPKAEE